MHPPDFRIVETQKAILSDLQRAFEVSGAASVWAHRVFMSMLSTREQVDKAHGAWEAEQKWLRASMTADGIPAHIQALVIERWNDDAQAEAMAQLRRSP